MALRRLLSTYRPQLGSWEASQHQARGLLVRDRAQDLAGARVCQAAASYSTAEHDSTQQLQGFRGVFPRL